MTRCLGPIPGDDAARGRLLDRAVAAGQITDGDAETIERYIAFLADLDSGPRGPVREREVYARHYPEGADRG